ncbi:lytic transglycosylase domain-containing protein [Thermomonospora catenispora]|uniref:aggregation-promoting factor C-terminal-like domain-containing protein n=1 Tax=Thermomonospora catenispora TaxID=2493090 RepID=UPI001120ED94|nr:lytic transglycosylase domain-containing protein [Thermomonospora catenispora]TNY35439.1 lytic transglycosylase domain-containing protein [Thermomonospora catenispora]
MPLRIAAVAGAAVALVGAGAVAAFATSGGGETATVKPTPPAEAPRQPDPRQLAEQQRLLDLRRADEAARKDARRRPVLELKGRTPTPTPTATPEAYAGNPVPVGEAQQIAKAMLPSFGFDPDTQFGCLVKLWDKESGWRTTAQNPTSGAYGIPQALPGSKMASAGADWRTNPRTQIKWGLGYIKDRYGTPCAAWAHSQRVGWY